jgi:drug/metabolite transporter (DMT)-like permease
MGGLSFKQSLGLVVFWYCVTLVFNWTAFNLVVLKDDPALALIPNDITLIEMFACTICGALTLYSKGLAFVPPPEVRTRMLALAITNAAACQLFMIAMDYVALSLVQTIRACQPLFTVVVGAPPSFSSRPEPSPAQPSPRPVPAPSSFGRVTASDMWLRAVYVCFNESYSATTYATLIPICLGFALAAGGDPKFEQTGFALAVTSTCCLVAVNTISRRTLAVFRSTVSPLQVQAWATSGSFYLLLAPWCFTGARARSSAALPLSCTVRVHPAHRAACCCYRWSCAAAVRPERPRRPRSAGLQVRGAGRHGGSGRPRLPRRQRRNLHLH